VSEPDTRSTELKAVAAAAIGSISVGFVPFFITGLQRAGVDTVSSLVWRYLVALAVLVPLALWRHDLLAEWRRGGKWLALNGLTLGMFQVFCYFKAVEILPTSVVVTIFYVYPVLTLILDRLLFAIPSTPLKLLGIAVIIAGVGLTSYPGFAGATLDPKGVAYILAAALGYALYIAAAYPFTRSVAPVASATFIYGAYGLGFGLWAAIKGFAWPPTPDLWLNVLFIGTLGGALQILSFSYALPRLASSGYAVIVCLEVVTVVLAGVVLLGEKLAAIQWAGIIMVLAGILMARLRRAPRSSAAVPAALAPKVAPSEPNRRP
jgi:inner membrane transporter RhtA